MAIKKPPPDDPEQSARFVETAKKVEADKTGEAFARALKQVIPKKKIKRRSSIS
jgi:hypothetical protein